MYSQQESLPLFKMTKATSTEHVSVSKSCTSLGGTRNRKLISELHGSSQTTALAGRSLARRSVRLANRVLGCQLRRSSSPGESSKRFTTSHHLGDGSALAGRSLARRSVRLANRILGCQLRRSSSPGESSKRFTTSHHLTALRIANTTVQGTGESDASAAKHVQRNLA